MAWKVIDMADVANETPQQVVHRCLDLWREDLYASNGLASLFAAKAIVGELKLAGYDITKVS
jgi:hypothetical protein